MPHFPGESEDDGDPRQIDISILRPTIPTVEQANTPPVVRDWRIYERQWHALRVGGGRCSELQVGYHRFHEHRTSANMKRMNDEACGMNIPPSHWSWHQDTLGSLNSMSQYE